MAKKPEIETILTGGLEIGKINKNFKAIQSKFTDSLSRFTTTDTPNFMDVNLDVGDANITNVNQLDVFRIDVVGEDFKGFDDQYIYKLALLNCDTRGAILTHDINGDPICYDPSDDGLVLKTRSSILNWEEDIDTDTDTVGITVQEDGVTVATNVTNIDFLWTPSIIATTPASDQVDLGLTELLDPFKYGPFTGTATAPDGPGGIVASSGGLFSIASHVRRMPLPETTTGSSDCWAVFEGHNYFLIGGSTAPGTWAVGTRFYGPDGTADRSTVGTQVGSQLGTTSSASGGATITYFRKVDLAGVKYVDMYYSLLAVSPGFLTTADICHRYVGIIDGSTAIAQSFETPSGVVFTNTGSSQASSAAPATACPVF